MDVEPLRTLVERERDAIFQRGNRIVLARRSIARYVAAVLFVGAPVLAALAMGALAFVALALASGAMMAFVVLSGTAPYGYRYPLFAIDTHARVLLNAKGQLIAPVDDARLSNEITAEDAMDLFRAHGIDVE